MSLDRYISESSIVVLYRRYLSVKNLNFSACQLIPFAYKINTLLDNLTSYDRRIFIDSLSNTRNNIISCVSFHTGSSIEYEQSLNSPCIPMENENK